MHKSISKQTRPARDIQFWSGKDTVAADSLKYIKEKSSLDSALYFF